MKELRKYRTAGSFTLEEREAIIKEYLSGGYTKSGIWEKYTGDKAEHGNLNRWMTQLGMNPAVLKVNYRLGKKSAILEQKAFFQPLSSKKQSENTSDLESEIIKLKAQLEVAELKAEGYRLMIEVAEKEYKLPIQKKSDFK